MNSIESESVVASQQRAGTCWDGVLGVWRLFLPPQLVRCRHSCGTHLFAARPTDSWACGRDWRCVYHCVPYPAPVILLELVGYGNFIAAHARGNIISGSLLMPVDLGFSIAELTRVENTCCCSAGPPLTQTTHCVS